MSSSTRIGLGIALLAAVSAVAAVLVFSRAPVSESAADRLARLGVRSSYTDLKVTHSSDRKIREKRVLSFEAMATGAHLKANVVEDMDESAWLQYSRQRLFEFEGAHGRGSSPYPGAITNQVQCREGSAPQVAEVRGTGWAGLRIRTQANRRRQIAVCDESEAFYTVDVLMFHCPARRLVVDLEHFLAQGHEREAVEIAHMQCE